MKRLMDISDELAENIPAGFYRSLYHSISAGGRFTGVTGPKGVGKTTLLLQLAKKQGVKKGQILYLGLDDPVLVNRDLVSIVTEFNNYGGRLLILDEIERYGGIKELVKWIKEECPGLIVFFACSSVGDSKGIEAVLEDSVEIYKLKGLSFREYLDLHHNLQFPVIRFDELIEFNRLPGLQVINRIKPLMYFNDYLAGGFYPFAGSGTSQHMLRVKDIIKNAVTGDIMSVYNIDNDSVSKIYSLLTNIAESGASRPNIEKLALYAGTTRDSLLKFLKYLEKAELITWLAKANREINYLNKPARIAAGNHDLLNALRINRPAKQDLMETFLYGQLKDHHRVESLSSGSLLIDKEYVFHLNWIADKSVLIDDDRHYSVVDGIVDRQGNSIPLWMLGFLY